MKNNREFYRKDSLWVPSRRDFLKSAGIVLAGGLAAPRPAQATGWSFQGGASQYGVNTSTGTVDTTASTLLVASISHNGSVSTPGSIIDSQGNTWLTAFLGNGTQTCFVGYCFPTSKSATHSVKIASGADAQSSIFFGAFSFGSTVALTSVNTNHSFSSAVTSRTCPTITPSAANALVICAGQIPTNGALPTVDSSMNYATRLAGNSSQFGGVLAYIDQPSAAAIGPTVTSNSVSQWMDACVFYFVASGGAAAQIHHRVIGG